MRTKGNDLISPPDRVLRMPLFTFLRPVPNDKANFVNLDLYTALLGDKATTSTAHFIHTQIRERTTTKWGKPKRCPPSVSAHEMRLWGTTPIDQRPWRGTGNERRDHHRLAACWRDTQTPSSTSITRPVTQQWDCGTMEVGCWWSAGSMCYFCVW